MSRMSAQEFNAQQVEKAGARNLPKFGERMSAKDFLAKINSGEITSQAFKNNAARPSSGTPPAVTTSAQPVPETPPAKDVKRKAQPEYEEQCALFEWARNPAVLNQLPALKLLSSSLNGVKLSKAQAGKAKAAGMLAGESDVKLPVSRGKWIGLIIEMKAGQNTATEEQLKYGSLMEAEGHSFHICYSWQEAKGIIENYLSLPRPTLI